MFSVDLIHQAIADTDDARPLPCETVPAVCAITGEYGPCVPFAKLFGPSFTDKGILAAPESGYVSVAAWTALSYRPERASCWWCDGVQFEQLDRPALRDAVLIGVDRHLVARPWCGGITTSYKKHLALRAPVNVGRRGVWAFDDGAVDLRDGETVIETWHTLLAALRGGIWRQAMQTLQPPCGMLSVCGVEAWGEFEDWARPQAQSRLYRLLVVLLPGKAELAKWDAKEEAEPCAAA